MPPPARLHIPDRPLTDLPPTHLPLTAIERYHLARSTLSSPYTITYLITYPSSASLPDERLVRRRITELQAHFALLNARIRSNNDEGPRSEGGEAGVGRAVWEGRAMVRHESEIFSWGKYPVHLADGERQVETAAGDEYRDRVEEWVLQNSAVEWEDDEPLWRVQFHTAERDHKPAGYAPATKKEEKAYMSISVAHELMDGIGLTKLVQALLAESVNELPYEPLHRNVGEGPKGDTSWSGWFSLVRQSVVSVMPGLSLSNATSRSEATAAVADDGAVPISIRSWPTGPLSPQYPALPHRIALHRLPAALIHSLKSLSLYHGIPILTPVLQIAFLAAVQAVHRCPSGEALTTVIPFSERDPARGDRWCTGQYTPAHLFDLDLTGIQARVADERGERKEGVMEGQREQRDGKDHAGPLFWAEARKLAYQLAHPSYRSIARANLARLDNLTAPLDYTTGRDPFVIHLERQAASDKPYPQSVSFSNIGKVPLPTGAEGVVIAGTCAIGDPPYEVILSGTDEKGLVATIAYIDGGLVKREEVRRVLRIWEGVLRVLMVDGREVGIGAAVEAAMVAIGSDG